MESFRILLLIFLVLCALSVSFSKNLLVSIIIYMSYSLIMSMIWILLESPDLAITEAAVGAGVTSVLFFITLKRIGAIGKEHVEKPDETTREIHTRTWVRRFERYYKEAAIILGMVIIAVLFFGLIGYFTFIRPYFVYRKLPKVLAETDGKYVYFHGKKETKISLVDLSYCYIDVDVPRIFHPGFIREFLIHKFSSDYGSITLDVPKHGTVKLQFVANAEEVAKELLDYINKNS